jgi:hypothetical protein
VEDRQDRMEPIPHGGPDLSSLQKWSGNGPIDLGDWLILLEPIMSNRAAKSETLKHGGNSWKELQVWYEADMKLSPLAKSSHSMETPAALKDKKWTRLGRRVASMLLKAIPFTAREEMISGKKTTVFAILALQVAHQAGGLAEKKKLVIQWFGAPPRGGPRRDCPPAVYSLSAGPCGVAAACCPCVVPSVPSPSDRW